MVRSPRTIRSLTVLLLGVLFAVPAMSQEEPPPVNINDAMKQLQGALNQLNPDAKQPAHFSKLKEILCIEKVLSLELDSCTGSSNKFGNIGISTAEARWKDGEKVVRVVFTDLAGMPTVMAAGRMGLGMGMDIEQETETTKTKTMDLAGHRALWTWNSETARSEVRMFALDRFGVEIDADNLGEKAAIQVGEALPFDRFESIE